jgi:hypothetical protein
MLSGADREAAYESIAATIFDDVNIVTLHHLNRFHGMAADLEWQPRLDVQVLLKDIRPAAM